MEYFQNNSARGFVTFGYKVGWGDKKIASLK